MTLRQLKLFILAPSFVILVTGMCLGAAMYFTPHPPVKEIKEAREALEKARRNRSKLYSQKLFAESQRFYNAAISSWKKENKKFFLKRNFEKTREYAILAEVKAIEAGTEATNGLKMFQKKLKHEIDSLEEEITAFELVFLRLPLKPDINRKFTRGKMTLTEGRLAYDKKEFLTANEKINNASRLVGESFAFAGNLLSGYFKNYRQWISWSDTLINESKEKGTRFILVEKLTKKCYLYENGQIIATFQAELGPYWIGNKRFKGDKATPEGIYKITKKLEGKDTKYYKALLLDYPNEEDKQRFEEEKQKGTLPRSADIGSMIEIHGGGGKGTDWTNGCIALTNGNMDVLFPLVDLETQVVIVGSLKNLTKILNQ
jgi:hypothetical protein